MNGLHVTDTKRVDVPRSQSGQICIINGDWAGLHWHTPSLGSALFDGRRVDFQWHEKPKFNELPQNMDLGYNLHFMLKSVQTLTVTPGGSKCACCKQSMGYLCTTNWGKWKHIGAELHLKWQLQRIMEANQFYIYTADSSIINKLTLFQSLHHVCSGSTFCSVPRNRVTKLSSLSAHRWLVRVVSLGPVLVSRSSTVLHPGCDISAHTRWPTVSLLLVGQPVVQRSQHDFQTSTWVRAVTCFCAPWLKSVNTQNTCVCAHTCILMLDKGKSQNKKWKRCWKVEAKEFSCFSSPLFNFLIFS